MPLELHATAAAGAPSWGLMGVEPFRAAFEYLAMRLMDTRTLPPGDGHPVMIFPGLATDEKAVAPLRAFCAELGYAAQDWGRGLNTGPQGDVDTWLGELADEVVAAAAGSGERITLIGWSLGGIYAREVAKRLPDQVRQVITIGTPFAGSAEQTHVGLLYRLVNGQPLPLEDALRQRLAIPPDVPTTSIYSRTDGLVAWQACVQAGAAPHIENIEVEGSHCGLAWNSSVFSIVADRLSQPDGAWRRYA